jgi:nucleotide-binding universal stress UspA family protein
MIEKILLAVSGLGHAEQMLKALMAIPAIQRSQVTILHVVPPQTTEQAMTAKMAAGEQLLARAVVHLDLDPQHVTTLLRSGDPKDIVCHVAEELDTDLIIMGSRGLNRLVSILENSVSQYVFQLSPRPMLLVKDDVYVRAIERITVAMDKSAAAQGCLDMALFLLRDVPDARLNLVRIDPNIKRDQDEVVGLAAERDPVLAAAVAQAQRMGIACRCFVGASPAGETICRLAESAKTDLLLLGSPDRRPSIAKNLPDLDRLLGSSLSDYVRVHANSPVLLARTMG